MGALSDSLAEVLPESMSGTFGASKEKSSTEVGSVEEVCDAGEKVGSADRAEGRSWSASSVVSDLSERRVGKLGVDFEWKPLGKGPPLLWGGIVAITVRCRRRLKRTFTWRYEVKMNVWSVHAYPCLLYISRS